MTDQELADIEITPSRPRVPHTPEERKRLIEWFIKRHGYDRLQEVLTTEEKAQYEPKRSC